MTSGNATRPMNFLFSFLKKTVTILFIVYWEIIRSNLMLRSFWNYIKIVSIAVFCVRLEWADYGEGVILADYWVCWWWRRQQQQSGKGEMRLNIYNNGHLSIKPHIYVGLSGMCMESIVPYNGIGLTDIMPYTRSRSGVNQISTYMYSCNYMYNLIGIV